MTNFKKNIQWDGTAHLQYGQGVCFCEKRNEISWSIKCNEFCDHINKY